MRNAVELASLRQGSRKSLLQDEHILALHLDAIGLEWIGRRSAEYFTRLQTERRTVPPALELAPVYLTAGQLSAKVRTVVAEREEAAACVDDTDAVPIDFDGAQDIDRELVDLA